MRSLFFIALLAAAGAFVYFEMNRAPGEPSWPLVESVREIMGAEPTAQSPTTEEALEAMGQGGQPAAAGRDRELGRPTGRKLDVQLIEEPAVTYGDPRWSESDRVYAGLISEMRGVTYDPLLGHAARELAYIYSVEDGLVPSGALEFVLLSAGAAEWGVKQSLTGTSADDFEPIRSRVAELVSKEAGRPGGVVRVGIGEAYEPGARPPRTIAVLVSRGELVMDPTPKAVRAGGRIRMSGTLPAKATKPRALAMYPNLDVSQVDVTRNGNRFSVDLAAGEGGGQVLVELLADTDRGPAVMAQLAFHVDEPVPTSWVGRFPPNEEHLRTVPKAERYAYELLDLDRADYGLPTLQRDPALDAIARGHSEDMRDHGFFGHHSPNTGSISDRVDDAGYVAVSVAENIARNSSLWGAEQGLMWSLGHRINILSEAPSHVGIGVAMKLDKQDRPTFHLTQVFARPASAVDPREIERDMLSKLSLARRQAGLDPLRLDDSLSDLAVEEAVAGDPTPRGVLERIKEERLGHGALYAWVQKGWQPKGHQLPIAVEEEEYGRVGLGIAVDEADLDNPVSIVVVLSH